MDDGERGGWVCWVWSAWLRELGSLMPDEMSLQDVDYCEGIWNIYYELRWSSNGRCTFMLMTDDDLIGCHVLGGRRVWDRALLIRGYSLLELLRTQFQKILI